MIVFAHLYNDSSGSPQVLSQVVRSVQKYEDNKKHRLYIGCDGRGLLDQLTIVKTKYFYKRISNSKVLTLFSYLFSQIVLFFKLILNPKIDANSIIYVNTLLPFGAAVYGKLTGKKVIYHLHEVSLTPQVFKKYLVYIARICGDKYIYVSDFHLNALPVSVDKSVVLHNCVSSALYRQSFESVGRCYPRSKFQILMLASLRDYKGIPEFLQISKALLSVSKIEFVLVANGSDVEIKEYFDRVPVPSNVKICSATMNPGIYYQKADLLMNLSRVDLWVETFGLTVLEGMTFGLPVIAPPTGGPCEIVRNNVDGFLVDSRNIDSVCEKIILLLENSNMYEKMSSSSKARSMKFSPEKYYESLIHAIYSVNLENM